MTTMPPISLKLPKMLKTTKMTKIPPKFLKLAKYPPKPLKCSKYPQNLKNYKNSPQNSKMTKIPSKPKKNDRNIPKT